MRAKGSEELSPGVLGGGIYKEEWEDERLGERKGHGRGKGTWVGRGRGMGGEEEMLVAFGFPRELE